MWRVGSSVCCSAAGVGGYCKMISVADESPDSSFKVSDRRRFSSEGEPIEETAETSHETPPPSGPEPPVSEPQASASPGASPLPPASVELLVVSLAIQAQMQLGGEETPENRPPDLDVARHTIDLVDVLKGKTEGNLTLEESRLLDNTLTELRFRYIQRVEEVNKKAKA